VCLLTYLLTYLLVLVRSSSVAAGLVSARRGLLVADGQQRAGAGSSRVRPRQGRSLPVPLRPAEQPKTRRQRIPGRRLGPGGRGAVSRLLSLLRLGERYVLSIELSFYVSAHANTGLCHLKDVLLGHLLSAMLKN